MQTVTTIGLDIAKSVFQVHGVDANSLVVTRITQAPLYEPNEGRSTRRKYPVIARNFPVSAKEFPVPFLGNPSTNPSIGLQI